MHTDREITAPLPEHRKFTFMTPAYCVFFSVLHRKIKSGQTYNTRMLYGLKLWQKVSGNPSEDQFLICAGDKEAALEYGQQLPWYRGVGC